MTETKQHLLPGPDHPIRVLPGGAPVTATIGGTVIASTSRPLLLEEATDLPVYYFPREDVEFAGLTRTDHQTHCPYKGDCSYFTVTAGENVGTNAAWSYEQPYDAVSEIAGYIAFDPDQVDVNVMD